MNLQILTWNSHNINDNLNYTSIMLPDARFDLTSSPVYADRAEFWPYLSGMVLPAHSFTFQIVIPPSASTLTTLREQLKQWFSLEDFTPHALVAQDTENSNKQWQLVGFPARLANDPDADTGLTSFLITIAVAEPVWTAVSGSTDTWSITATAQTHSVTIAGDATVRPTFAIKPTGARTGQYPYNRWVPVYPRTTVPLANYPIDVTNGGFDTTGLVNDTAISNQINQGGGINNSVTTIPVDTAVGGGLPAGGGIAYVGTEQIFYAASSGTSLTGVVRGYGGTTAASHADNAVIALSKMFANGADIAVQFDANLVNVWITGANTVSTKVWIAQTWQPSQQGALLTALPNSGTAVTVQFAKTTTGLAALKALKTAKNSVFLIDSEAFTFSPGNVDLVGYQITSCNRAQKNTSTAIHAVAAAIIWLEHDIWMLYGNATGSPYITDDTQKPLLDLTNSTNTSWVQTQFYDTGSVRPAAWTGIVLSSTGHQSVTFTGNQKALANPASELGMDLINYLQANIWKAETASLVWQFYQPAGITTVSMAGSKFLFTLTGTAWPAIAGLQKSNNNITWLTVWTEAIPVSANTWASFTHNGQSLSGTYTNIRLALNGTIAAQPNNDAAIQGDTVTLTLDNTKTPVVALNAENSIYYLACKITNNTSTDYFTINYTVQSLNTSLTVNTLKKTVTAPDGSNAIAALTLSSTRNDWLPLAGGQASTLQFDDVATGNVTITTTWNDRNW